MYIKRDYSKMTPIEVYALVATGKLKRFPSNYLDKGIIKEITRHVVMTVYGYTTKEEIIKNVRRQFLMKNYMGGFRKFFDVRDYNVIAYSFPEFGILPWEYYKEVEANFWKDDNNILDFLNWLAKKENLDLTSKEDLKKIGARLLTKYGGTQILEEKNGLYGVLNLCNPGKFREWEITKVKSWNKQMAIEAVKWLIEEKLKISLEEACNLTREKMREYDLGGMLQAICGDSIVRALNLAYPNRFYLEPPNKILLKKE